MILRNQEIELRSLRFAFILFIYFNHTVLFQSEREKLER